MMYHTVLVYAFSIALLFIALIKYKDPLLAIFMKLGIELVRDAVDDIKKFVEKLKKLM